MRHLHTRDRERTQALTARGRLREVVPTAVPCYNGTDGCEVTHPEPQLPEHTSHHSRPVDLWTSQLQTQAQGLRANPEQHSTATASQAPAGADTSSIKQPATLARTWLQAGSLY